VGETVRSIFALGEEMRVLVVDDGSSDNTADAATFSGATVLRHSVNRGQGAALQTGTEWALAEGAEVIVHFDADGQFVAEDIATALTRLQEFPSDILLGSRYLSFWSRSGAEAIESIPITKRYVLFPIARMVNWAFTGLWLTDVHNGFRVLSRSAAEKIFITHDGMAHNTEIIGQIRRLGLSFEEVPVRVRYRTYGQGLRGGFKILGDLLFSWFA